MDVNLTHTQLRESNSKTFDPEQRQSIPPATGALLLVVLTLAAFSETYFSAPGEFSKYDLILLGVITIGIVIAQLGGLALARKVFKGPHVVAILLGLFGVFNFYCLYLVLNLQFAAQPLFYRIVLLCVGFFIVFTLFRIVLKHRREGRWISILLLIPIGINVAHYVVNSRTSTTPQLQAQGKNGRTLSPNITQVRFTHTPNVYMVSFDALVPRSISKQFLGIEDPSYHKVLDENFTRFRNVFTPYAPTMPSLNALLALDEEYYMSLEPRSKQMFFNGFTPSPLLQIFSANGYTTNTVYYSRYFGLSKGPFVDNYPVGTEFTVCEFLDDPTWYVFFGACKIQRSWRVNRFLESFGLSSRRESQMEFLLSHFAKGLESGKPQVFLAYIFSPGHTPRNYRHDNEKMRETYIRDFTQRSTEAAKMLQDLVDFVRQNDETALLYVFGDHGPAVMQGQEFNESFVKSLHAVYGGMHPKEACKDFFRPVLGSEFTTTLRIARQLVACLANGEDPFLNEPSYMLQTKRNGTHRYEDYLYE